MRSPTATSNAMDNGARVRVSIRIDKQARAARIDFTGRARSRRTLQRASLSHARRCAVCVPHAGERRDPDERRPFGRWRSSFRRLDAQAAVSGGSRRRQRRDFAGRHGLPVRGARRARGQPGHDEQLHLRRRRASVLRNNRRRFGRRPGLRRNLCSPDAHGELASDRSRSAGVALPVRLEDFRIRRGSGGAGRHRGDGDGSERRVRF